MAARLLTQMAQSAVDGWSFYRRLGSPKFVVAPMVDASELAFRALTRRYGAQLCYTPMIHSRMTIEHTGYLDTVFSTNTEDRPLIGQLCGNDPDVVLAAAQRVIAWKPADVDSKWDHEYAVDAIDLNLGCPQGIARRGHYGAFLLEETNTIVAIVKKLVENLPVPVTVKIRILPTWEDTIRTFLALQDAGASMITVHGRTRTNMKHAITAVDWDIIKRITSHPEVRIPVIANGGIAHIGDVEACLKHTGAQAVMVSEGILENPGLFSDNIDSTTGLRSDCIELAAQYVEIAEATNCDRATAKGHLLKFLHGLFSAQPHLREELQAGSSWTYDHMRHVCKRAREAVSDVPAAYVGGVLNAAHPRYSELCAMECEWKAAREAQDTIGLSHPAFRLDPREPGYWYTRHRTNAYKKSSDDAAAPTLDERLAAFKAAKQRPCESDCSVGNFFGAEEEYEETSISM